MTLERAFFTVIMALTVMQLSIRSLYKKLLLRTDDITTLSKISGKKGIQG